MLTYNFYKMKNIFKFLIISVIGTGMVSCSEESILDLSPVNNISLDDALHLYNKVIVEVKM